MKKLAVAGRKYTNREGQEKTEWINVGVLNVAQNGKEYVLLDPKVNLAALEIGENGMVMVGVFEEQQQNGGQGGGYQQPQQNGGGNYQQPQGGQQSYRENPNGNPPAGGQNSYDPRQNGGR